MKSKAINGMLAMEEETLVNSKMEITVRRYGLLHPKNWGWDCEAEMAGQTRLWNALVEIEKEHRAKYFKTTQNEEINIIQKEVDVLMARREELINERTKIRRAERKKVKTPKIDEENKEIGQKLRILIEKSKELRRNSRDASRPQLALLEEQRKEAVKRARQTSGLYWPNYNAVVASYDRARAAAIKSGAELKLHFRNANRLTNQIQGGLLVDELHSGKSSQIKIDEGGESGYLLTVTAFTAGGRRNVTWPIKLHRPFPDDARIQECVVTRKIIAGQWKWEAIFTCRIPQMLSEHDNTPCGIDIGWRQTDHGLRVAVLVADNVRDEIILPQPIIDRSLYYYDLIGARHQARHEMLLRLSIIDWDEVPQPLGARGKAVLEQKDERGALKATNLELRGLAAEWRFAPDFLPDIRAEIIDWANDDRRQWLQIAHGRRKVTERRIDFYRCTAKKIVERYGIIGIEDINLKDMSSHAIDVLPQLARRMRFIAGLSDFTQALSNVVRREGVRMYKYKGKSSFLCYECGHETEVKNKGELYFTCDGCNRTHDQDFNAAHVILEAARQSIPSIEGEEEVPAWKRRLQGKALKQATA